MPGIGAQIHDNLMHLGLVGKNIGIAFQILFNMDVCGDRGLQEAENLCYNLVQF